MLRLSLALGSALLLLATACVQPTYPQTLEFSVDTRGQSEVSSVGIRGDFAPLNWEQDLPLSDPDQDGIYTGSVVLDTPYLGTAFKCVLNGYQFELEEQPNRMVEFDKDGVTAVDVVFDQP